MRIQGSCRIFNGITPNLPIVRCDLILGIISSLLQGYDYNNLIFFSILCHESICKSCQDKRQQEANLQLFQIKFAPRSHELYWLLYFLWHGMKESCVAVSSILNHGISYLFVVFSWYALSSYGVCVYPKNWRLLKGYSVVFHKKVLRG